VYVNSKIALVVQGMFELSDSIAYDCLWQYEKLRHMHLETNRVRVFAEKLHRSRYSDWPVESLDRLWPWIKDDPNSTIIYHYCDGWPAFETRVRGERSRLIVRWHNNTPPWFFAAHSRHPTANTTRGFQRILQLAETPRIEFWVNSSYSARQLSFLGVPENRIHVVYPASAYLSYAPRAQPDLSKPRQQRPNIRLLFVGRITPHKGHKHLVAVAAVVQRATGKKVDLQLAGRADSSMQSYVDEVRALARDLSVSLFLRGEINDTALLRLYDESDVFLALTEHEGFGLPLFEAMRLAVPVVALRSTAIKDLFCEHPLGIDVLDYREIALRVIAALDPNIRDMVIAWQVDQLLTSYDKEIVTSQLEVGMAGHARWPTHKFEPNTSVDKSVAALRAALWTKIDKAACALNALRALPKDTPERFVTRYDIAAYSTLLESRGMSTNLYDAALAQNFTSNRRFLGPPLRLARRAVLSVQSGLVRALGILDANVDARFERMENQLSRLQSSVERNQESRAAPAEQPTTLPAGRTFGDTASAYDKAYFEGGLDSHYASYTRDGVAPGRELARTIFELFQPASALEAGCALGFTVKALRELDVAAFGYDISEWAVREANSPFILRFDISQETISEKFDLVFAFDVMQHIPLEEVGFALRNLWNACSRYLVVVPATYPAGANADPREPTHRIFREREWWKSMIETTCETALDPLATNALDRAEHSMKYNYNGRVLVASKR
jgi:glycosyltransferase involved in cell wall biosynthesis